MIHYAVMPLSGPVSGALAGILEVRSPFTGTITRVVCIVGTPNGAGAAIFDVNVAGASIFTDPAMRPEIAAGQTTDFVSGLTHEIEEGDLVTVDADTIPAGGFPAKALTVIITVDDGVTMMLTPDEVVKGLYRGALARAPDTTELASARTAFRTASLTNAETFIQAVRDAGHALFISAEYIARARTDAEFVSDLYHAYLGREPDADGLADWLAVLTGGATRAATDTAFSGAAEFMEIRGTHLYGGTTGARGLNPMTAAGDIIVGGASGAETRLAKGTNGQVLALVSGAPAWATPAGGRAANPMTASGDLIYGGASGAETRLPKGTDGQALVLASGVPAWTTPAGGSVAPFDATHPDAHPASPNAADDEFDTVSLDTAGTRRSGATAWSIVNQGSAVIAQAQSHLLFSRTVGDGAISLHSIVQTLPSQVFKYRCKLSFAYKNADIMAGMLLRDSVSGKAYSFHYYSGSSLTLKVTSYTSNTAQAADTVSIPMHSPNCYLEIEQTATNRIWRLSYTGVEGSFIDVLSQLVASHLTPNQIGVGITPYGAPMCVAFDWFRRIS